jgi:hypothetical protein
VEKVGVLGKDTLVDGGMGTLAEFDKLSVLDVGEVLRRECRSARVVIASSGSGLAL